MKKRQSSHETVAPVTFSTEVLRRIRKHARTSMAAEICGVLIGEIGEDSTQVEALIEGEAAQQGGSHVTFTQETWAHIYKTKDAQYPEKRIVGWYHSHPGFGVFLSDHDEFIQRNFFSDSRQVAWVFDPHSDEEGCFALREGEIVRLPQIALRDEPPPAELSTEVKTRWSEGGAEPELGGRFTGGAEFGSGGASQDELSGDTSDGARKAVKWSLMFLSYVLVAILGFLACIVLLPRYIIVDRDQLPAAHGGSGPARASASGDRGTGR